jgi:hypothetical protein
MACTSGLAAAPGPTQSIEKDRDSPRRTPVSNEDFDYEAHLDALRKASGIKDPPETGLVRVIAPDELGDVWSNCMQEQGFAVRVTFDGGLAAPQGLSPEQSEAYQLADYLCFAQYPVDQSMYQQFGNEQVEILYRYYVKELVPCLEGRGISVASAPSEVVFRENFPAVWTPYDSVDTSSLSEGGWEALNKACPQSPSDEVLWPGSQ